MRSRRRLAAFALGLAVVAGWLAAAATTSDGAGTAPSAASAFGDVARPRAVRVRVAQPTEDPETDEATEDAAEDATEEPAVETRAEVAPTPEPAARPAEIAEPVEEVVTAATRMLDVEVVDGTTCAPLTGAVVRVLRQGRWTDARGASVAFDKIDDLRIAPPAGYGCLVASPSLGTVAPRARRFRMIVPVYPGTTWRFRALDWERRPIAGATAQSVELDEHAVTFAADTSAADGIVGVHHIPRIPYRRTLSVSLHAGDGTGRVYGLQMADGPPEKPVDVVFSNGGRYRGPPGSGGCDGYAREPADDPTPTAPLAVRVRWRDGVAAANVRVVCDSVVATTDEEGRARFAAVRVGPVFLVAGAHGFLPTAARAVAGSDETVEIVEAAPRTVRVLVTDEEGRALPAARVTVESSRIAGPEDTSLEFHESIAQLDDDVELLTPLTDASGRVTLDAPRGAMDYEVVIGGAHTFVCGEAADDVHVTVKGER